MSSLLLQAATWSGACTCLPCAMTKMEFWLWFYSSLLEPCTFDSSLVTSRNLRETEFIESLSVIILMSLISVRDQLIINLKKTNRFSSFKSEYSRMELTFHSSSLAIQIWSDLRNRVAIQVPEALIIKNFISRDYLFTSLGTTDHVHSWIARLCGYTYCHHKIKPQAPETHNILRKRVRNLNLHPISLSDRVPSDHLTPGFRFDRNQ